jgi:hypothetical protein
MLTCKNTEKSDGSSPERRPPTSGTAVARTPVRRSTMNNIFYIIGVVVVVLFILGYFGLR